MLIEKSFFFEVFSDSLYFHMLKSRVKPWRDNILRLYLGVFRTKSFDAES